MHIDFSDKYKIIAVILAASLTDCAMVQKTAASAKSCTAKNANDPACQKPQPPTANKQLKKNFVSPKGKPPPPPSAPKTRNLDDDELPNRKEDPF